MSDLREQAIRQHCRVLRMPTIAGQFARLAEEATREGQSHVGYLEALLAAKFEEREARAVTRLLRDARLPRMKTLDGFEFDRSGVSAAQLRTLAEGDHVTRAEPVLLVGEAGTGKTHPATGLCVAACRQRRRVRFTTATALINELAEAAHANQLSRALGRWERLDLICIDELGYPTLARYLQRLCAAQGIALARKPEKQPRPVLVAAPRRVLTSRTTAWLVLRRAEKRSADDRALLAELRQHAPELDEAIALAEKFAGLIRDHAPDRLDPWLQRARNSTVRQLQSFAKRLMDDYAAVRAGVALAWSNGQTERQVNRLKTIKRQMYGRANLDLLSGHVARTRDAGAVTQPRLGFRRCGRRSGVPTPACG